MPSLKQKDDDVLGILDMLKKRGPETPLLEEEEEDDEELSMPVLGGSNSGGTGKGPSMY